METRFVYVACASADEAATIARAAVSERLAACANVLGPTTSFYWWNGEMQADTECALVLKTAADRSDALVARIVSLHSYAVPGVAVLPVESGNPDFLTWVVDQTR